MADPTPQQLAKALTLNERMGEWATMLDPNYRRVRPGMKFDEYQKQVAEGLGVTGWLTQGPPQSEFSRPADLPSGMFERDAAKLGRGARGLFNSAIDGLAKAGLSFGFVNNGGVLTDNEITDTALNILGGGSTFSKAIGAKAVGGPGGKVLGANVYQGGPHKYGPEGAAKSLEHIGKGEGNTTFGFGRYDAGNPKVATGYQDSVGPKILDLEQPARELGLELSRDARIELGRQASAGKPLPDAARHSQYANIELRDVPSDKLEKLIDLKRQSQQTYLYKHDLPDEDIARYLDWDKPLSEQPENVRAGVARVVGNAIEDGANGPMQMVGNVTNSNGMTNRADPTSFSRLDGSSIHEMLQKVYGRQGVSEALGKVGIPGLKYLDQGSRNAGAGSHNYVTWDQDVLNRMKLLERNGETFGMTGNPAMLAAGQNQDAGPPKMALELAKRLSDQEFYAKGGI